MWVFICQVDIAFAPFIERFHPLLLDVKKCDITSGRPKLVSWIEVNCMSLFIVFHLNIGRLKLFAHMWLFRFQISFFNFLFSCVWFLCVYWEGWGLVWSINCKDSLLLRSFQFLETLDEVTHVPVNMIFGGLVVSGWRTSSSC